MSISNPTTTKLRLQNATPYLVLAVALVLTAFATVYVTRSVQAKDRARFDFAVQSASEAIHDRLNTYVELLRGARGLFTASAHVSAEEFRTYVASLELGQHYQGVQGIGYTMRLSASDRSGPLPREEHIDRVPSSNAADHHAIIFLEPQDLRNQHALGFDMFSEAVRREAMIRACDTGEPAMSGKVTLVQEIDSHKQAGFLIYLPVYRRGAPLTDVVERRKALLGFVYSPFRADDFFRGLSSISGNPRVRLEVFDGTALVSDALLHSSLDGTADPSPRHTEVVALEPAGRTWSLRFQTTPEFDRTSNEAVVPLVLVGGLMISLLLFALTIEQARGRAEAERISREMQRSEEALRQANQAKDEFLAMLGHELRNPLGAVSNALQVMVECEITDPHLRHAREVVERQVRHQTRLVEDLLDVSRVYSGKITLRRELLDVNEVVRQAAEGLEWAVQEQAHQLTLHLPDEPLMVDGDAVRLGQVFTNLIHNAIKYTHKGGRVDVAVRRVGGEIEVSVKDTGVGISPEMLNRIFDVFTQAQISIDRSQGGLGLGLTLVRHLVRMHGGRVEARSPGVGQGSEFLVYLSGIEVTPTLAADPNPGAAPDPDPPARTPLRGPKRVLVIEDLTDARETLAELLELHGHHVETAPDGAVGLEKLCASLPDVALIDIGLPGLDGYEVASRFRAEHPNAGVRLIALTGYGQPEDRIRAEQAGFHAHVVKPIDPDVLWTLLDT